MAWPSCPRVVWQLESPKTESSVDISSKGQFFCVCLRLPMGSQSKATFARPSLRPSHGNACKGTRTIAKGPPNHKDSDSNPSVVSGNRDYLQRDVAKDFLTAEITF
jgi:hypothetical protein